MLDLGFALLGLGSIAMDFFVDEFDGEADLRIATALTRVVLFYYFSRII